MSDNNTDQSVDSKDKGSVSKDVYENVMKDLHSTKSKYKELEEKIRSFEDEKENLKVKSLKEKEEWQKLAEIRENEAKELKKKLDTNAHTTSNYFKRSEVRQLAIKNGIRDSALEDIDLLPLDEVVVETTNTGKINVLGADKFVDRLRTTRPHWFQDKSDPKVATSTPSTTKPSKVDAKDVVKLYKEGKMAEYNEAMSKLRTKK